MTIQLPPYFSFRMTVNSHGWYGLAPFSVNEQFTELRCVISLNRRKHALVRIRENNSQMLISIENGIRVTRTEKERIKNTVRSMLRIDEPLDRFYALCRKEPHLRWVPKLKAGRLLRSQTVFEDVVKMLFTTNCSWALTKIQTTNLVQKLGAKIGDGIYSFPPPEVIAAKSERWLRKELSCGYRAPYLAGTLPEHREQQSGDRIAPSFRTADG
jgi:3-methyladenine DNA glycosylase/8-oxoguanine DNA glycosylase